jgi:hypothetical protein
LHSGLDEIDRVDHEGAECASKGAQCEMVYGFEDAVEKVPNCGWGCGTEGGYGVVEGIPPGGVEDFGEMGETETAGGLVEGCEVE